MKRSTKTRPAAARSLTALLRRRLDEVEPESGKTVGQLIVEGWVTSAMGGNLSAVKEILDRTEGKVAEKAGAIDPPKAYVFESPDSLWPSDPNSDPTVPWAPHAPSGVTLARSCS